MYAAAIGYANGDSLQSWAYRGCSRKDFSQMNPIIVNALFIFALMGVGLWLESINGKNGWVDEYLTWAPMGVSGLLWVGLERAIG